MSKRVLEEMEATNLTELAFKVIYLMKAFTGEESARTADEIYVEHSGKFGGNGVKMSMIEETLSDGSTVLNLMISSGSR